MSCSCKKIIQVDYTELKRRPAAPAMRTNAIDYRVQLQAQDLKERLITWQEWSSLWALWSLDRDSLSAQGVAVSCCFHVHVDLYILLPSSMEGQGLEWIWFFTILVWKSFAVPLALSNGTLPVDSSHYENKLMSTSFIHKRVTELQTLSRSI
ncbi:hypothetical protein Acr_29g0008130 [Actinidia rufa]|uniref:Uncharacterized protein n=1 Tax=Actinidia rufa TaxID=165716 RepID=A0A7J0HFC5_9ERIC|nr:hypothetical protein Acr_29g0008130 [Actinidia rufa]